MESLMRFFPLIGRIFLATLFIPAGLSKIGAVDGTIGYMESMGVPGILFWPTVALEALGGIAILIGYQTRYASILLAGFCMLSAILFHMQPGDQMQMAMFMKNFAIAGGFLILAANGPGAFAMDTRAASDDASDEGGED